MVAPTHHRTFPPGAVRGVSSNAVGDIRAKKARSLPVVCKSCAATRILDVDGFPDIVALAWFEPLSLQALRRESVSGSPLEATLVQGLLLAFERTAHLRPGSNALVVALCLEGSYLRVHHRCGFIPIPAATRLGVNFSSLFFCDKHLEPVGDEGTQRRDVWSAAVKLKCSRRDNVSTWDPKKASAGVGADCYRWPVMQW